jgi:hypothetical protein
MTHFDDYSCMTRHVTVWKEVRVRGMNPSLSIYATKPYGRSDDGTVRVHIKDNVAMSTATHNYSN